MDDMDDIEDLLEAPYKTVEKSLADKAASLDNNEVSNLTLVYLFILFINLFFLLN